MNIVIINKRFSPLRSATGFHAYQLALHLINAGHQVQFITTLPSNTEPPVTNDNIKRVWINSFYEGKSIPLRLISDLVDAMRLVRIAKSTSADHTIVMSDPPFLQLLSTYYLAHPKTSFWFMDIYPQAFVARGLISARNPIYKWYMNRLKRFRPQHFLALGEHQARYIQDQFAYNNDISLPIGLQHLNLDEAAPRPYWYEGDDLIYLLYKGNLGSAHDDQFLVALINQLDPSKYRLIVNATGIKAEGLLSSFLDHKSVEIVDKLSDTDLTYADIHVVTLLDEWTHICVPSKALLAVSVGSAVLYHGSPLSDTWAYIEGVGWKVSNDYMHSGEIQLLLSSITMEEVEKKKTRSAQLYQILTAQLKESYANYESKLR